jgi:hypothetical protein
MKLLGHNLIVILLCSTALECFACVGNNNSGADNTMIDTLPALFEDILQFIDADNHRTILIISRFTCHSCFKAVVERARVETDRNFVHIIILGAGMPEVRRLNAIYRRFRLGFIYTDEEIFIRLADSDPEFAHTIFLGMKFDSTGSLKIYDGKEDYDDIEQRTDAVIDFLFN